jgi:hypothetical protein
MRVYGRILNYTELPGIIQSMAVSAQGRRHETTQSQAGA